MTQEHLTPEQIQRFALPVGNPDLERTRANAHLQSCPQCRAAFQQALGSPAPAFWTHLGAPDPNADPADGRSSGQEAAEGECLDREIMARYVERAADSVEVDIVEMHLETCAPCRSEIALLTAYYQSMDSHVVDAQKTAAQEPSKAATHFAKTGVQEKAVSSGALPAREGGRTAGLRLAAPMRLRQALAVPHVRWRLAFGGSALAAVCVALLHFGGPGNAPAATGARPPISNTASGIAANAKPFSSQGIHSPRANSPKPVERRMASLIRRGGRTMADVNEQSIALFQPDGAAENTLRPTFRWQATPQAVTYELTCIPQNISPDTALRVSQQGRNEKSVSGKNKGENNTSAGVISYMISANAQPSQAVVIWTIPATQPALYPATTYTWIVRALDVNKSLVARSSRHEELFFRTPDAAK